MKFDLSAGEIKLSNNQPICARQARGLRITCTSGVIWITVDGEPGDTYLRAGQTHELRGNGLAIIESIGEGRIRLHKPEAFRQLRRLAATVGNVLRPKEKTGFAISRYS